MQRGQIFQRHGAWHLRYRVDRKQMCQKLTDVTDQYRTIRSVRPLADEILQPLNEGRQSTAQTLQQFIETQYLPHAKLHKRPSTWNGYQDLYKRHVQPHIGGLRLISFRTVDGQRLLNRLGSGKLSHRTLLHIKSFVSGVFTHAVRMGMLDSNPMRLAAVPPGEPSKPTHAYSKAEIDSMVEILDGMPRLAVLLAAYCGLSMEELQGLQWQDLDGNELSIRRTIWRGIEGLPKTQARADSLPMLKIVVDAWQDHQKRNPGTKWVFEGPLARPVSIQNMGNKRIREALKGHVEWVGWHALRRGFATRLHEMGVQDKIIQRLLRHSSLAVTMGYYVKALPEATREAVERLNPKRKK